MSRLAKLLKSAHDQPMNVKVGSNTLASATALEDDARCIRLPAREVVRTRKNKKSALKTECYDQVGLAEIEAALGRLDAGVYGLCQACGAEISLATLERNPVATLCDKCS